MGSGWKKGKGQVGMAKHPSSTSPPSRSRTEEAGVASAGGGCRHPHGSAAAGEGGKTEEESRGSQPRAHLGPESLVEAALRRRAAADYGVWWWWCLEAWEAGRLGWGGARRGGVPHRPFYRHGEVGSGEDFSCSLVLRRGRGGWPESRLPVMG
jgi:hypothetical protein